MTVDSELRGPLPHWTCSGPSSGPWVPLPVPRLPAPHDLSCPKQPLQLRVATLGVTYAVRIGRIGSATKAASSHSSGPVPGLPAPDFEYLSLSSNEKLGGMNPHNLLLFSLKMSQSPYLCTVFCFPSLCLGEKGPWLSKENNLPPALMLPDPTL